MGQISSICNSLKKAQASLALHTAAQKNHALQCVADAIAARADHIISANKIETVYKKIAERASFRAERYVFGKLKVKTILVDYAGNILGTDLKSEVLK